MLKFDFLEKDLGIVYDFFRKKFLMLHCINWPHFIVWMPFFLKYWWICVLQLFFDAINFEINPKLLTKPFLYMAKKSRQKFKYLESEMTL